MDSDYMQKQQTLLIIISGPAGSGKTTLCNRMLAELGNRIKRVITTTTRLPREGEIDGVDYHFVSEATFRKGIEEKHFFEYARVYNYWYGSEKQEILKKMESGVDVLMNVDVQGVESFQNFSREEAFLKNRLVTVFVMPPNLDELKQRLKKRGKDSDEVIERRLQTAAQEVKRWKDFDYCIPSSDPENDFACLLSIYGAEKLRMRG